MKVDVLPTDLQAENAMLKAENAELKTLVRYYEEQFRLNQHRRFGASSEKSRFDRDGEYDIDQLSLFNEAEVESNPDASEPEIIEVEKHCRKAKRSSSDRIPEDLPVEVVEHTLPEEQRVCPECGETMHAFGHNCRRELKVIPAQVVVVEHRQEVYACRNCEKNNDHVPIEKAPVPEPVIKGSFASPELIAYIIVCKFVLGLPLYRQEQEFARNGIMLSRQTMSNWMIRCTEDWLELIYEHMKAQLLMQAVLHADETTLQVLREPGKTAQSKSYMWLYRTSGDAEHPIVLYEYQTNRKSQHPAAFLAGFEGYLHADGYDGYHKLPTNIVVVGCWAHVRRKFDEALKALPEKDREVNRCGGNSNPMRGKRYCDRLFDIEREISDLSTQERYLKRQELAKPVLDEFYAWAETLNVIPKSGLGKAVHYALSQRNYLDNYLLDGRLEISNNRAERSIKPFVIGRKNWLFANTPKGAKASSIIYSIVETAKENGLKPFEYLTFLLKSLPNATTGMIDSLLPWSAAVPDICKMPL